jgi:N-acetylated-alpha-linked acidic dipeptidase
MAAEHGAIGCLIYSDPHEDGYYDADVYPKGPMRPPAGVQRGSVMDMTLYPGDPLSPGWASEAGARKLPLAEAKTVMKIPVLPISYEDAQPILEQLDGPVPPPTWRGALGLTYHAGPGSVRVHMKTD